MYSLSSIFPAGHQTVVYFPILTIACRLFSPIDCSLSSIILDWPQPVVDYPRLTAACRLFLPPDYSLSSIFPYWVYSRSSLFPAWQQTVVYFLILTIACRLFSPTDCSLSSIFPDCCLQNLKYPPSAVCKLALHPLQTLCQSVLQIWSKSAHRDPTKGYSARMRDEPVAKFFWIVSRKSMTEKNISTQWTEYFVTKGKKDQPRSCSTRKRWAEHERHKIRIKT